MIKTYRPAAVSARSGARHGAAQRRQRGVAAIEFAIVFLLFFMLVWGILTYGFVFAVQQTLTLAAENGARAALHYQAGAQNTYDSIGLRTAAAQRATMNSLEWLQKLKPFWYPQNAVNVQSGPCTYDNAMTCFTVSVTYPYGQGFGWYQYALIPSMPGLGLFIPQTLVGKAAMQMDPDNLLVKTT